MVRFQRKPRPPRAIASRPLVAWLLVALALASAAGLGGSAPFGRLALTLGLPEIAAPLLDSPLWRGVAFYRAGRFEQAAEAFRVAGPRASFNRGNALALAGRYREAVAAYDAVLFRTPGDAAARSNRALVAALVRGTIGDLRAGGRIAAHGGSNSPDRDPAEDGATRAALPPPTKIREQEMVRQAFKGQSVVASRAWLATLADQPGRYLKRRLSVEHDRRQASGLGAPIGGDPW